MRFKIQDSRFKILINILVIFGLLLPSFSFAPTPNLVWGFAQQPLIKAPETLEEAKEMGEKILEVTKKELPGILERIWREEVLPIWQKLWNFFKKLWNFYVWPAIKKLWQKIATPFKKEIERRKPIIEKEFKKEKQELKTEVPKVGKSLWEKFKELIK
ncbi:MAG: hypothetical protein QME57_01925 [Patescibacteria group bacterium]|nr:hypothetical protein [Patescibacteria group bacterium]